MLAKRAVAATARPRKRRPRAKRQQKILRRKILLKNPHPKRKRPPRNSSRSTCIRARPVIRLNSNGQDPTVRRKSERLIPSIRRHDASCSIPRSLLDLSVSSSAPLICCCPKRQRRACRSEYRHKSSPPRKFSSLMRVVKILRYTREDGTAPTTSSMRR